MDTILKELFTYQSFVHAFSGMVGGASAITVFYPLNYLRSKLQVEDKERKEGVFQVLKNIVAKEGFQALYQVSFLNLFLLLFLSYIK